MSNVHIKKETKFNVNNTVLFNIFTQVPMTVQTYKPRITKRKKGKEMVYSGLNTTC